MKINYYFQQTFSNHQAPLRYFKQVIELQKILKCLQEAPNGHQTTCIKLKMIDYV
jgi:hypothetical protein